MHFRIIESFREKGKIKPFFIFKSIYNFLSLFLFFYFLLHLLSIPFSLKFTREANIAQQLGNIKISRSNKIWQSLQHHQIIDPNDG